MSWCVQKKLCRWQNCFSVVFLLSESWIQTSISNAISNTIGTIYFSTISINLLILKQLKNVLKCNKAQRFPTFLWLRTPQAEKKKKRVYPIVSCENAFYDNFIYYFSVNLKLMKIWRTPGWEPLSELNATFWYVFFHFASKCTSDLILYIADYEKMHVSCNQFVTS